MPFFTHTCFLFMCAVSVGGGHRPAGLSSGFPVADRICAQCKSTRCDVYLRGCSIGRSVCQPSHLFLGEEDDS